MGNEYAALPCGQPQNARIVYTLREDFLSALEVNARLPPQHPGDNVAIEIGVSLESDLQLRLLDAVRSAACSSLARSWRETGGCRLRDLSHSFSCRPR